MHYVTSESQLTAELASRALNRQEIRTSVRSFISHRYGIKDMFEPIDAFFKPVRAERPVAVLARQVASICAEDISFTIGARRLGLDPVTVPFGRDAFATNNHDKLHRVKIPWISWSKKGNRIVEHERIVGGRNDEIEGMPLDTIRTLSGIDLVSHHADLRESVTGQRPVIDVSGLYVSLMRLTDRRPPFVFRETDGRETRVHLSASADILDRDRPPASWYYILYLSWFIDGSYVLFETYDNPMAEVARARSLFDEAVGEISRGCGFKPLVVKIPHLSQEMLYCNRHVLRDRGKAMGLLDSEAASLPTDDTVAFFGRIAHAVNSYR